AVVGTDWHVSTQPSLSSSSLRALLTNISTSPSTSLAMHVAQLPDSHENGADIPISRAVCRIVVPGWWSTVSVRPPSSMVTRHPLFVSDDDGGGVGSAGVKRSMWIRDLSTSWSTSVPSTMSMNGGGPQMK